MTKELLSDQVIDDLRSGLAAHLDETFPDLVRLYQDDVYSGALRLSRNQEDAADITQETFVRAYRALTTYPAERIVELQVAGWIWTIALNLCRNRARQRARRGTEAPLVSDHQDPAPGPEAEAMAGAEDAIWERRLSKLSGPQRTAVVLRHVVGLSYREISAASGRPIGTVKADVHRGLARLGNEISTEGTS